MSIIDRIARTLFVCAWADWEEEHGRTDGWSGVNLFDLAPETTKESYYTAYRLVGALEEANGMNIHCLAAKVPMAEEDDLGYYLAMESLGHGVSWEDDHPPHDLHVPYLIDTDWYSPTSDGEYMGYSGGEQCLSN